jgi:hypothetical protein
MAQSYGYDALDRLTAAQSGVFDFAYSYDAADRLIGVDVDAGASVEWGKKDILDLCKEANLDLLSRRNTAARFSANRCCRCATGCQTNRRIGAAAIGHVTVGRDTAAAQLSARGRPADFVA